MCEVCGCGDPEVIELEVQQNILASNDAAAAHNRAHFERAGMLVFNLMGSPGAGKTALLEATARQGGIPFKLAAMSGDLATEQDAQRLSRAGVPALSITTGSACHLDAQMVHHALHRFDQARGCDVLVVENVGNLVCPAVYDLGQRSNVVALSVTEGEDKPLKYPVMFQRANLVVLTKLDLLPHLDFDLHAFEDALARVAPQAQLLRVSSRTGEGVERWVAWLYAQLRGVRALQTAAELP